MWLESEMNKKWFYIGITILSTALISRIYNGYLPTIVLVLCFIYSVVMGILRQDKNRHLICLEKDCRRTKLQFVKHKQPRFPRDAWMAIYRCPSCKAGGRQDTTWAAQSGDIHFKRWDNVSPLFIYQLLTLRQAQSKQTRTADSRSFDSAQDKSSAKLSLRHCVVSFRSFSEGGQPPQHEK